MNIITISDIARAKGVTRQAVSIWARKNARKLKLVRDGAGRIIGIQPCKTLTAYMHKRPD